MGKALHKLGLWMDDFTIKKKFYIFYVVCVLIPLIVTDSVVFLTTAKFDRERREHEMSNIASAVEYCCLSPRHFRSYCSDCIPPHWQY